MSGVTIHEQIGHNALEPNLKPCDLQTLGAREFILGAVIRVGVVYLRKPVSSGKWVWQYTLLNWTVFCQFFCIVLGFACRSTLLDFITAIARMGSEYDATKKNVLFHISVHYTQFARGHSHVIVM